MKIFRIFISSPGDVGREREVARKVIKRVETSFGKRLKLDGYFWEHEPMYTTRGDFQEQIPLASTFDLVICILWSRLGSRLHPEIHQKPNGEPYASGTEYEFESATLAYQASGSPDLLVYRRTEMPLFPPEPRELMEERMQQWKSLKIFCDKWFRDAKAGAFTTAFNPYQDSSAFECVFEEHLRDLVEKQLLASGERQELPQQRERWWYGSPYRGLMAFDFEHEPVFFGRTRARDEVLGALRAHWVEEKCPFVLIFGASGSGKSSLMRAGLLPWMVQPGVVEGVNLWRRAILRPAEQEGDLIDALTCALVQSDALPELLADGTCEADLAALLRDTPKIIVGLIKGALSMVSVEAMRVESLTSVPVCRLALGVDQLEEVFTLNERFTPEDRQLFFRALHALARSGYVWTVATLRSDFYNRCEESPELMELKKGWGQYHLLSPTEAELSQMIRYPAEAAGVTFEEDSIHGKLEEVIAREAHDQPGALPLLEYALDTLYHLGAESGILTHMAYEQTGRVAGAVARKAEEIYQQLGESEKGALDEVLRAVVKLSDDREEIAVRKNVLRDELILQPRAQALADAFVNARLFTSDLDGKARATITVAHESLLRVWPRVTSWVRRNHEFLRQHQRLGQAMAQWNAREKHDDYLLASGLPLLEAESLLSEYNTSLNTEEKAFVAASRTKAQVAQARRRKHRALIMSGLSILTAIAMIGGLFSWINARKASAQREQAEASAAAEQVERVGSEKAIEFVSGMFSNIASNSNHASEVPVKTLLDSADSRIDTAFPNHPGAEIKIRQFLATSYYKIGQPKEALHHADRSLALARTFYGENDHPELLAALNEMAYCLANNGRNTEALPIYEESLAMARRIHQDDHPDLKGTLIRMGYCLGREGNHEKAYEIQLEALAMQRRLKEGDDINTALSLHNVGECLRNLQRLEEARKYYEEALAMRRRVLPPDHPHIATSLEHIARCLWKDHQRDEAIRLVDEALDMRKRLNPGDNAAMSWTLELKASALYEEKRYEEALEVQNRRVGMQQRLFGANHAYVAKAFTDRAKSQLALKRLSEAAADYQSALDITRTVAPTNHTLAATLCADLVQIYQLKGDHELEEKANSEYLKELRSLPDTSENLALVAQILKSLADRKIAENHHPEAMALYLEEAEVQKKLGYLRFVEVAEILPGGIGAAIGLQVNDRIVEYAETDILLGSQLSLAVESITSDHIPLKIQRRNETLTFVVKKGKLNIRLKDKIEPVNTGEAH